MIHTIQGIVEAAKGGQGGIIAVAAAHDEPVIEAVVAAKKEGIATPILVGHADEIRAMLPGLGEEPADYEIIAGDTDTDCAAKAVALGEALQPEFKDYQSRILKNAQALAASLKESGFDLVSGGTDNHLMLVDLRKARVTGKEMEKRLDEVNITVNKNAIPNDPEKPFVTSGIRVGTPAVTTRGFREEDMKVIGELMWQTATDFDAKAEKIRAAVAALTEKYPLYQ